MQAQLPRGAHRYGVWWASWLARVGLVAQATIPAGGGCPWAGQCPVSRAALVANQTLLVDSRDFSGKMCIEVDPTSKISFISEEVGVGHVCSSAGGSCRLAPPPPPPSLHPPHRARPPSPLLPGGSCFMSSDVHRVRYLREEVPLRGHLHHQPAPGAYPQLSVLFAEWLGMPGVSRPHPMLQGSPLLPSIECNAEMCLGSWCCCCCCRVGLTLCFPSPWSRTWRVRRRTGSAQTPSSCTGCPCLAPTKFWDWWAPTALASPPL
jgi:hypothetical protein